MSEFDRVRKEMRSMTFTDLVRLAAALHFAVNQNAEALRCARWLFVAQFALWCVWLA